MATKAALRLPPEIVNLLKSSFAFAADTKSPDTSSAKPLSNRGMLKGHLGTAVRQTRGDHICRALPVPDNRVRSDWGTLAQSAEKPTTAKQGYIPVSTFDYCLDRRDCLRWCLLVNPFVRLLKLSVRRFSMKFRTVA